MYSTSNMQCLPKIKESKSGNFKLLPATFEGRRCKASDISVDKCIQTLFIHGHTDGF